MYRLLAPRAEEGAVRMAAAEATKIWLKSYEIAIEARLIEITCDAGVARAKFMDVVWLSGRTAHSGATTNALVPHLGCQANPRIDGEKRLYFASRDYAGIGADRGPVLTFCSVRDANLPAELEMEIKQMERQAQRRRQPAPNSTHLQILRAEMDLQLLQLREKAASDSAYAADLPSIPRDGILKKLHQPQPK